MVLTEEPNIIYEDANFLAVDKPAGMLTHKTRINTDSTRTNPEAEQACYGAHAEIGQRKSVLSQFESVTLVDWLLEKYPEISSVGEHSPDYPWAASESKTQQANLRPGIVHRLDRETSGILLVARTQKYFEYLQSLFRTRQIKKTYLALVFGSPKEKRGRIDKPIGITTGSIKRSVHSKKMFKPAVTAYTVKKTFSAPDGETFSLLEVIPETGRTHQIRVHCAAIGHPVVGDRLYGRQNQPAWASRLMLHAYSLEFSNAEGQRLKLEVEPQQALESFISYPQAML